MQKQSLYLGLGLGSPTSLTQQIRTESPEPHPGRVFIGEGQEAGLLILGVNRLDVIQVRGSWNIGIGFYAIVSWSSGVWPELFLFLVTLGKGLLYSIMIGSGLRWCIPEERLCSGQCKGTKEPEPEMTMSLLFFKWGPTSVIFS
jgi:hypothetical protein